MSATIEECIRAVYYLSLEYELVQMRADKQGRPPSNDERAELAIRGLIRLARFMHREQPEEERKKRRKRKKKEVDQ